MNQRILIAYFSRSGQNYFGGGIENLKVGNTKIVAEKIAELTGGDLFEIIPVQDYPIDYNETTEVAMDQLRKNIRPELVSIPENLHEYENVILGYPNWWGTMPMPVFTFLEENIWKGKKIIPFCTHEGSGLSDSIRDIKKTCPGAEVEQGIAIYGHMVMQCDYEIKKWSDSLKLK